MIMLLLLTSCFKKDETDEIIEEGAENITNILEQESSTEGTDTVSETNSGVTTKFNEEKVPENNVEETVAGTWEIDSKTEEQIVKEFEAEIDSLFNLIDEDGKK